MRSIAFFFLSLFLFIPATFALDHTAWDFLLKEHVQDGFIDYERFLKDEVLLAEYLSSLEKIDPSEFLNFSREEKIAVWINAFNASVVSKILRFYPVKSTNEIPNFWDDPFVHVAGERYSLREMRERIIRQNFHDERAAIAMVPGTKSAPIFNEAFEGEKLIIQLEKYIKEFLMDSRFNEIEAGKKKIKLAHVFKELEDDFVFSYGAREEDEKYSNTELALLSFIRLHVDDTKIKEWIETRKVKIQFHSPKPDLNDKEESKCEN